MYEVDVIGVPAVVADLGRIGVRAALGTRVAVEESAIELRDEWRDNAKATAGQHGKWYPSSIRYDMKILSFDIEAAVAPKSGLKQGSMNFELGSHNQPPHLDGLKARDHQAPLIERRIAAAIAAATS